MRGRLQRRLQTVRPEWLKRNVVNAGVVAELSEKDGRVTVTLDPAGARIGSERNDLTHAVRRVLSEDDAVERVRVQWRLPQSDAGTPDGPPDRSTRGPRSQERSSPSRPMTPLQAELIEEGVLPQADVLGRSREGPRSAEAAGYRDGRPSPLPGPSGPDAHERYDGDVPVIQWEIDPLDPARRIGEADVENDGWEHRIWWQVHPRGLAYASIQAMPGSDAPGSAGHPLGRSVAVNLVYDLEREAVVAVYGTAGDFRPFVSVFLEAFTASAGAPVDEASDETDSNSEDEPEETE